MRNKPWLVFAVVWATAISFAITQFKVPPTMVAMMESTGSDLTMGGFLMSIVAITAIFLALFGGILTVKFKTRTLGLFAICCEIIGGLVGFFSPNFTVLLLSRLIEGIGYGTMTTIAPTIISQWFPEDKRRRPMGIYSMWVPVGMLLIFNGSNPIMAAFDWKTVWLFCAILLVAIFILFFIFVHDPKESSFVDEGSSTKEQLSLVGKEFKNSRVWLLTLVFTIFGLGCAAYTTFAPTFCVQALGMGMEQANTATSLLSPGMIAGGIIVTILLSVVKKLDLLLIIVTVITGIFFTLSFLLNAEWQVIPFVIANGIVLMSIPPVVFALIPDAASGPKSIGVAMGISSAGDHIGAFVGTVALGAIVQYLGGGSWLAAVPAMGIFSVIGIIGAFGFSFAMKKHRKTLLARSVDAE